ncbi:MAG: amidohydrolase family protein [Anaerolineae bacterium]|nr:MAG: amidohydrolase family protein [Anaerolineae bacterium]
MKADLILINGTVVTMNAEEAVYLPGILAVKGDSIVAVGPASLAAEIEADEVVDCAGQIVMPGLINAHTHVPMSLLRGLADDLRLDVWLHGYMLPVEKAFVNETFCHWGTLLSCAEMIRSGVTCFADMYYNEDAVADAVADVGMRAICAETIMKWPTPNASSYDEGLEYCRRFIANWKGHPLIVPAVGPHAPYTCTPEILRETARLSREEQVPLMIHISETAGEVEISRQVHGLTPALYADQFGVLDHGAVVAHGVHLTEEEMALLARKGVGLAHNPSSNLKLASGVAPVSRMLALGVTLGLGTDGPASNNNQDMFEELHLAALLAKGFSGDPTALPVREALTMATIGGARALHLDHLVGSLERGKRADLAVVAMEGLHTSPKFDINRENIYARLVYAAQSTDVRHVMVNGRWLMRDRALLTVSEEEVMAEVQRVADRVSGFLVQREKSLLDKLVALGELEQREIFEVQVKARVDDEERVMAALDHPDIVVVKPSVRNQYDTYFFFDDAMGRIRYREDYVLESGQVVESLYTLTLVGPAKEREYANSVVLSRFAYSSRADRSLRFYKEYFQPRRVMELEKHRRRFRIKYQGVPLAVNLDQLTKPTQGGPFLEIKSRTWSKRDAERKAERIGALLKLLGMTPKDLVKREYADF